MGKPDRTEPIEFTNMCMLTDENNRVLIQKRNKQDWAGNSFPGGHIERGESIVDSLRREMLEETGYEIDDIRLCGVKQWCEPNYRYLVLLFRARVVGGKLTSSDEGECFWVDGDKLRSLTFAPGFDETLDIFERDDLNEQIYIKQPDDSWHISLR